MNINYIILAHKNPQQLKRLVLRLSESWTRFFIHIDKEIDIQPFWKELKNQKNVFLLPENHRENTSWGDIGIVRATLNALSLITEHNSKGYCVLISGQDYPLKENELIYNFLKRNYGTNFINIFPLPTPYWEEGGLPRINQYKINRTSQRNQFSLLPSLFEKTFYTRETAGKINYLLKISRYKALLKLLKKRNFPRYLEPFGGEQWWCLPTETISKILNFLRKHPDYLKYHKYTLIPDEIFFHSIIMNIDKEHQLKIQPSLTHVNWDRKPGPLPVTFKVEDFKELEKASESKFFARKFDAQMDSKILNLIDKNLFK